MKVLVVIDKLSMDGVNPSCITQNLGDAAALFREQDVEIAVRDLRDEAAVGACLDSAGVAVAYCRRGKYSPLALVDLWRHVRRDRPDVLHCHGYRAANAGRLVGFVCGVPVAVHEHAVLDVLPHQFVADLLLRYLTSAGVAVSRAVADFMVRGRCVPRGRIRVVYNGTDLSRFSRVDENAVAALRVELEIPAGHKVVSAVTRFRGEKGNEFLLRAAPAVLAAHPEVTFVLAGDGPLLEALRRLAGTLGVSGRVRFPGFVRQVPELLSLTDVFVIPSLSEGFSYVAVEAMASGRGIVASRVGGLAEIVRDGVNGLLVPAGDSGAIVLAVTDLLADRGRLEELGSAGRSESTGYSLDAYVASMSAVYRELVRGRRGKDCGG